MTDDIDAQRDKVKAELAALGAVSRALWQALVDAPEWAVHDINDQPPPPLWHTHVTITESEI